MELVLGIGLDETVEDDVGLDMKLADGLFDMDGDELTAGETFVLDVELTVTEADILSVGLVETLEEELDELDGVPLGDRLTVDVGLEVGGPTWRLHSVSQEDIVLVQVDKQDS